MSSIYYPRSKWSAENGQWTSAPAINLTNALLTWGDAGSSSTALIIIPVGGVAADTIDEALLWLTPSSDYAAGSDTGGISVLDSSDDPLVVGVGIADVIDTDTVALGDWVADTPKSFDVTDLVNAALAVRRNVTFALTPVGGVSPRSFYSLRSNWLLAPYLQITGTPAALEEDPYSRVIHALWAMLEMDPLFCSLVKPGNRVKFTGSLSLPIKDTVAAGDLPEVMIRHTASLPHDRASSTHFMDTATFTIDVATGDQRLTALHAPLKFAIVRAFSNWSGLTNVKWNDERIIIQARHGPVVDALSDQAAVRRQFGWTSLWQVTVDLNWSTASMMQGA